MTLLTPKHKETVVKEIGRNFYAWHEITPLLLFPFTVTESATSTSCPTLNCSEVAGEDGQTVALPAGRTGWAGLSALRWTTTGQQRLTVNLPVWFPTDDPHSHLRLNGESRVDLFSPGRPAVVLVLPQTRHRMLTEENIVNVDSLCRPALRESTLRRLTESGGLQALINQWGDSSLEELETFIDSYFETLWEQSVESLQPVEPDYPADPVVREAGGGEMLSSIDRKLSKLDLLEDIRKDLAELRQSLEHSWEAVQEIREKSKQDVDNTC